MKAKIIFAILYMLCTLGIISSGSSFIAKPYTNAEEVSSNIESQLVSNEIHCEEESGSFIYLDSEQTQFLPNENIVVSYLVSASAYIVNYDYSQNGFNVISINIDENDNSRIVVELTCIPDSVECVFDISVELENGNNVIASLYAIHNEYGVFISPFSVDNALERYCQYAIQNNILTEEQAKNLFLEKYKGTAEESVTVEYNASNMAMPASVMSTETETIIYNGSLNWADDNGNVHSLRRVRVELYSKIGIISALLDTTHTDDSGYYEFDVPAGTHVILKIYAGDSNAMVKSGILGFDYCSEIDVGAFDESAVITHNETFSMANDFGKALQISQAVLTARDYAWVMMGEMPSNVSIWYPYDGEIEEESVLGRTQFNNCYYDPLLKVIKITGQHPGSHSFPHSYASWDVIMHEYGHHIQDIVGNASNPGLEHSSSRNNADRYENKDIGIRLAWAESWPTVFGLMAQQYYRVFLTDIDTVNDSSYTVYNGVNYNIETTNIRYGEACERSIMAVLWDLYDSANDTNDTISLGHDKFWEVTTGNQSKTFSDFINNFYDEYPEYIDDIGPNLTYYGMAPTALTVLNSSRVTETVPPAFSWAAQGGSTEYPNNSFALIFYDGLGVEILRTPTVTDPTYTLTQSEWYSVIYSDGDSYTIAVAAMQTTAPTTGEYISEQSLPYLKADIHMHSYTDRYLQDSSSQHKAYCECGEYTLKDHVIVSSVCKFCDAEHAHEYTEWAYYSNTQHIEKCACGAYGTTKSGHVLRSSDTGRYKTCIKCNAAVDTNLGGGFINSARVMVSANGSYILSNGIIVLVDEDIEAYFSGELEFFDPNDDLETS